MAICQPADVVGPGPVVLADKVEHDKIIASAVHFGELQLHISRYRCR